MKKLMDQNMAIQTETAEIQVCIQIYRLEDLNQVAITRIPHVSKSTHIT